MKNAKDKVIPNNQSSTNLAYLCTVLLIKDEGTGQVKDNDT